MLSLILYPLLSVLTFFFFNDTATTVIYTLSLHDALPISEDFQHPRQAGAAKVRHAHDAHARGGILVRSEEHTSELQSQFHLVCRLLLEKKKTNKDNLRYFET